MISRLNRSNLDVSVVILTKNSSRTIQRCLDSVVRETPREIVAVDALSTDSTITILRRYGVRLVVATIDSLGYSRKLGVQAAKGNFVMFVDSDIVLVKGCVKIMRRELQKYGWVGIHARLLSDQDASYWQRAEDQVFRRDLNRVGPKTRIGTGAAMFCGDILRRYSFDVNLKRSGEDRDLCLRLARDGYRVGVSSASAYHLRRSDFPAFAKRLFNYGLGDAVLDAKHGVMRERFFGRVQTMASQMLRTSIRENFALVPYWFVSGAIQFLGFLVGLSRIRESYPYRANYLGRVAYPRYPSALRRLKTSNSSSEVGR